MKVFTSLSTHWDREWYMPFQGFRYNLVKVTDHIIEALDSGKIGVFCFDGQTIVLEDYLEIKPENREKLKELISSGKLRVGPWYVMPDEILVSGESLIRNFLEGKREAEKFGAGPWKYGYMNDIFGHIAQMPQILKGFGINCAYLGRGLGGNDKKFNNFIWKSPDGSTCFGHKQSYGALLRGYINAEDKLEYLKKHISDNDDGTGTVIMLFTDDHGDVNDLTFDYLNVRKELEKDHEFVEGLDNIEFELEDKKDSLPCVEGELIETNEESSMRLVTSSISSYYPLKYENDICETLLENTISPMLSMAKLMNMDFEKSFYHLAYRYLLKNQPHDSICGCSTHTVHEDMKYRYSQVKSISRALAKDFEARICANNKTDYTISVINYDTSEYDGVFETKLYFDDSWKNKNFGNSFYQKKFDFTILDENGAEVPYQIISITRNFCDSETQQTRPVDIYRIAICAKLCAFGETVFRIVPQKHKSTPKDYSDSELCAENEYINLKINADGSVSIYDKESKKLYNNLNTFIDEGESGNGWFSEKPIADSSAVSSVGSPTNIETITNDILVTSFRVTKIMNVPKYCDYNNYVRSSERTDLEIITDITLRKNSKAVEFVTTVNNIAHDHRLRVNFPTCTEGDDYFASQAFTFVQRKRGVSEKAINFSEPEPYEKNTSGIVCVKNNDEGLSFISKAGIHECSVSKNGVISVTMLRAFGRIMFGNILNEGAQLEGKHIFKYALTTETDFAKLNDMKKHLFELLPNVRKSCDANSRSLLEVTGGICVSLVKPSEDNKGIIVRLFNPQRVDGCCEIFIKTTIKSAYLTNLAESEMTELETNDGKIKLEIKQNKIATLYLEV